MIYVALLRGINVGGNAKISMAELKTCIEAKGYTAVRTYINSGNVVFEAGMDSSESLAEQFSEAIRKTFGLQIRVLVKTAEQLRTIESAVPSTWVNDASTKCDVLFLWPEVDEPEILQKIPINSNVETNDYTPGAVIHRVAKKDSTKSRLTRIVGTELYQSVTIRNINTLRKLIELTDCTA